MRIRQQVSSDLVASVETYKIIRASATRRYTIEMVWLHAAAAMVAGKYVRSLILYGEWSAAGWGTSDVIWQQIATATEWATEWGFVQYPVFTIDEPVTLMLYVFAGTFNPVKTVYADWELLDVDVK